MRSAMIGIAVLSSFLSGCGQPPAASPAGNRNPGRYAGIGTFDAGLLWSQMAVTNASADPAAASIADDEHVIVVVDSHSGEVRQCGDHSGYCVTMNPWNRSASAVPSSPVKLLKHAADLAAEDKANSEGERN